MFFTVVVGPWTVWAAVVGIVLPFILYALMWLQLLITMLRTKQGAELTRRDVLNMFALQGLNSDFSRGSWPRRIYEVLATPFLVGAVFGIIGFVIDNILRFF